MDIKECWYELVIGSTQDLYEEVAAFFANYDIYEIVIYDSEELNKLQDSEIYWDYADEGLIREEREILYKVYFEAEEEFYLEIVSELEGFLKPYQSASLVKTRTLDPNEGLDEWKKYFKSFELVEGVIIRPSWEEEGGAKAPIAITMDPSGAFGTGTHETTRLCAELLAEELRSMSPSTLNSMSLLDVGTGSGILSILALKLGMGRAVGVEIDENALSIAEANAGVNGLTGRFTAKSDKESYGGPYDIVVANLVCHIILELKPRMQEAMRPGSLIILSGIIDGKEGEIEEAFDSVHYRLLSKLGENDWYAYKFKYLGGCHA